MNSENLSYHLDSLNNLKTLARYIDQGYVHAFITWIHDQVCMYSTNFYPVEDQSKLDQETLGKAQKYLDQIESNIHPDSKTALIMLWSVCIHISYNISLLERIRQVYSDSFISREVLASN